MGHDIDFDDEETLESLFKEARNSLIKDFGQNNKAAASALWPLLGEDVVRNLIRDPNHRYDKMTKQRLVWFYSDGPDRFIYSMISKRIGQSKYTKRIISERFLGDYTYFRYYAASSNPKNLSYVSGKLSIIESGGIPHFVHRSHNYRSETTKPEHTGFVFQSGQHLFFLGTRLGVLRLAVAGINESGDDPYMPGLVLSLRSARPNDPFAARFVMVHDRDAALIEELSSKSTLRKNMKLTDGERRFFQLTKGSYAYFMLLLHPEQVEGEFSP